MKNGNVVQFPNRADPPKPNEAVPENANASNETSEKAKTVLLFLCQCVRVPVFLVLYWLRFPMMIVCGAISLPALLAFLFVFFFMREHSNMLWGFGLASFGACTLMWVYDLILATLSPTKMYL